MTNPTVKPNRDKIILHLCADIGSDSKPYKDAGYDVRCIGRDIGVENYRPPENVYGIIANPPCTMFSIARTNAKTPRDIEEGLICVRHCQRIIWECQTRMVAKHVPYKLNFWYMENPATGYLKNYLGKPTYVYHPYEFGEKYTKATALWGIFNEPKKAWWGQEKPPKGSSIKEMFPKMKYRNKEELMHVRSMCCEGFAKSFFDANK